jgi:putative ABC transport system ATP-binding protein
MSQKKKGPKSNDFILEAKDLTKIYSDGGSEVVALDSVSLSVKYGESLAVVGPSGSGKTTFLELIGGLNSSTSGQVIVDQKNLSKLNDAEISTFRNSTIGFVFQMMNLQDYFSALENITLPMIAAGISKDESMERAEYLIEKVGLSDRKNHYPKQLSGGEMQRVAVARALANNPKVIMADEPTGKLDRENSDNVMTILMDIAKEGTTIILITHDDKVADRFERVITLEHGNIKKDSKK